MRFLRVKQSKGENLKGAVSRPSLVFFVRFCQVLLQTCVGDENTSLDLNGKTKASLRTNMVPGPPHVGRQTTAVQINFDKRSAWKFFPRNTHITACYVLFFHDFCPSIPSLVFVSKLMYYFYLFVV